MGEPYYRIATALSELENILYDQTGLGKRLANEDRIAVAKRGENGVPPMSSIKHSHRFPFRTTFMPVLNSANQFMTHDNATNRRFTIEYGGEFSARMYQAIDISAGTIAATNGADTVTWSYCQNLVAHLLANVAFKVSTDILYEFPGEMYFVWYSLLVPFGSRPALTRCLHECCWEWKWMHGAGSKDLIGQYNRTTAAGSLALQHPYSPLQSYELTHGAFTLYIPYTIFTLCNVKNAYPMVGVYSLQRYIEYSLNPLLSCINIWGYSSVLAADNGLIDPTATHPVSGAFSWAATPAITGTRLVVEYFVVHKDLQRMIALNAHGYLIRQYFNAVETLTDKTSQEISVTKIIETIYVLCRHERNLVHTPTNPGVDQVNLNAGLFDRFHEIDPFFLPVDEKPINRITLIARGQTFYKDLNWDELTAVWQFLFSSDKLGTSYNHCLGVLTFAHFYFQDEHTGSYNSGFGPNLRLQWSQYAFSQADPGRINCIVQGVNMVLGYRGALSIRYT